MERFIARHEHLITGTLSGYDRMLFKATLRGLSHVKGLLGFFGVKRVLLKDFGTFVEAQSAQIKAHAEVVAREAGRPCQYVPCSTASKEEIARRIAHRDHVREGLICVLTCVEPCKSYALHRDRQARELQLVKAPRKCLFVYFYFLDREFGLLHVRLQTWLPFDLQLCLNGREWLARQLDKAGIAYERWENCFLRLADPARAQRLMDRLLKKRWAAVLDRYARRCHPLLRRGQVLADQRYYWTLRQAEYATDLMFRDAASLAAVYPALVRHAIQCLTAEDILRFLGRKLVPRFQGAVSSTLVRRVEGLRIRHWVEENSLKMYDKGGQVLRVETTINNPRRFRVYRRVTRHGRRVLAWLPLRKGIADLWRRTQLSRAANARYLNALAVVGDAAPAAQVLDPVARPIRQATARFRPLHPIAPADSAVFRAVLAGPTLAHGFRNADIRQRLFPEAAPSPETSAHLAARTTRLLRLLRAHRLIHKVPHTRLYRVTTFGHTLMATALTCRQTPMLELKHAA
ncbi:MAG TPA: hypothetical protein VFF02_12775 [Anaeromyxobacteraceae bacterium]|nr:hypothetical protein [Anaeromyxobacteraceae bacterium]